MSFVLIGSDDLFVVYIDLFRPIHIDLFVMAYKIDKINRRQLILQ